MFKDLCSRLLLLVAAAGITIKQSNAQDSLYHTGGCGHDAQYMASLAVQGAHMGATAALAAPSVFPSSAIETCGKFQVYYEDLRITGAAAGGFNEPGGVGATRRNTLCQVLNYVQTVFDFSSIPSGQYIRLHIDTSFVYGKRSIPPFDDTWARNYGVSGPYYLNTLPAGSVVNGFVHDYIKKGFDPMPDEYHATLRMNFDRIIRKYPVLGKLSNGRSLEPISFNNGTDSTANCDIDLYSALLHLVSHSMGWVSFMDMGSTTHTIPGGSLYRSSYDTSIRVLPDPTIWPDPFDYAVYMYLSPSTPGMTFINGKKPPENYSVMGDTRLAHLSSSLPYITRLCYGDYEEPVMAYILQESDMRRKFTKIDINVFHDVIRLGYKSSYSTDSTIKINNHLPWSSRMVSNAYNYIFASDGLPELLPADYVLNNDLGAKIIINLNGDPSLHDADGDSLSVLPGSLVNFRGCGENGNNHNRLVLSNSNRTITYYPRHNFYGKAQFGFNLTDSKEKGAFVVYTIAVNPGSNVYALKGENLVVNGNFEEGSEVKMKDAGETINNAFYHKPYFLAVDGNEQYTGRLGKGVHLSDGHPFDYMTNQAFGTAIKGSYKECTDSRKGPSFGHPLNSFPWSYTRAQRDLIMPTAYIAIGDNYPDSYGGTGMNNRYQPMGANGILMNLTDTIRSCKRYILEFDARRTFSTGFDYPATEYVRVGFTASSLVTEIPVTSMIMPKTGFPVSGMTAGAWKHYKIALSYCPSSPANVLFLSFDGALATLERTATILLDNVSLVEQDLKLSVKISDTATGSCSRTLAAGPPSAGCPAMSYEWRNEAGVLLGSSRTLSVSPMDTTRYIAIVSDGCTSARDTFKALPCRCAPVVVFGKKTIPALSGVITGTVAPGYYYMASDVTISGSVNFTGAKILIEPGTRITVANNALLTLDSCHLFTCPDTNQLWKGITLTSGGSVSGRIIVRNNTLIEDAEVGISAVNPATPASGNIITVDSAVFNRNLQAVYIQNYRPYVAADSGYAFYFKNSVFTSRELKRSGNGYPDIWPGTSVLKAYLANGLNAPYYLDKNYTRTFAKNGAPVEAGIKVNAVGYTSGATYRDIIIGGGQDTLKSNLFDFQSAGIYAENSNINSKNNIFINMLPQGDILPSPGSPPRPVYQGCGIYATTSVGGRLLVKEYYAINSSPVNKFYDCKTGINAAGYATTDISSCRMSSSQTLAIPGTYYYGMSIMGGPNYKALNIGYNDLSNLKEGIMAYCNTSEGNVTANINNNTLAAVNPRLPSGVSSFGQYVMQGIRVECNTTAFSFDISPRIASVRFNTFKDVYNGIAINNMMVIKANVLSNTITNILPLATASAQYGISITNSSNAVVNYNNISADPGSTVRNSDKIRAVYAAFNTGLGVCQNTANYIGRGFEFAQVRAQAGTKWTLNTMNNGYRGFVLGSDIGHQTYITTFLPGGYGSYYGAGMNTWIGFGGGSNWQTVVEKSRNTDLSKLFIRNSISSEIPTLNTSIPPLPYPNSYSAAGSIVTTQQLANCNGWILPVRFDPEVETPIKSIPYLILKDGMGYGEEDRVSQWMSQLAMFETGIIYPELRDSFPVFNDFMNNAAMSRFKWITDLQQALAMEDLGTTQALLNTTPQAIGRVVVNPDIVITDYSEADYVLNNYRDYFTIYLHQLMGTLDSPDRVSLSLLAHKCPATDGAVVYNARGLHNQLSGIPLVYDDDDCIVNGAGSYRLGKSAAETGEQSYQLYPNPNSGSFTIRQLHPENKTVGLKVYNALGAVVYQKQVNFNNGTVNVNLGTVVPGVYLVCVGDHNGRSICLRFTVL